MRIIENYHHKSGVKKKKKKKSRTVLKLAVFFLIIFASAVFASNSGDNNTDLAVLGDSSRAEVNEETDTPSKDYDFSSIPLPTEGQVAFKMRGGRVWGDTNSRAPMASITKVVTALAVLEKAPFELGSEGSSLTFTLEDEEYYRDFLAQQGTVTGVVAGQSITEYDALQAILLASSNNIAETLARHYFGSQEEFVNYANSMLLRMGLENTVIADASGFNPSSVSTPRDLLTLGEVALENPVVAEIVRKDEARIMDNVRIPNYNALIGFDETNGIKPGFTDEAGYCLLFSAEFPDSSGAKQQFIAVAMGIQDRALYFQTLSSVFDGAKNIIAEN